MIQTLLWESFLAVYGCNIVISWIVKRCGWMCLTVADIHKLGFADNWSLNWGSRITDQIRGSRIGVNESGIPDLLSPIRDPRISSVIPEPDPRSANLIRDPRFLNSGINYPRIPVYVYQLVLRQRDVRDVNRSCMSFSFSVLLRTLSVLFVL